MNYDKYQKNIIKVLIVFGAAFLLIIGYLSFFDIMYGKNIASSPYNKRNRDKEDEVLRGSILDRNLEVIVDSRRLEDKSQQRIYKKGYEEAYAPVIGYYSRKYGTSGLEQAYTGELLDADTLNPFRVIRDVMTKADRRGNSLMLTIDSKLQKAAYEALGNYRGSVVAMDPKTGEVLAMVSKPVFNPASIDEDFEKLSKQHEEGPFLNRAIQPGLYPPGSTFKIIVAGAALENIDGIENKIYEDRGKLKIGNYTLANYGNKAYGNLDMHGALVVSSNVVFGQIGMDLGVDKLKEGAEKFYFNRDIPFELPTAKSNFPSLDPERQDSLAQSAIGQHDVRVTPLHMAMAASAIANDGVMMKPFVVKSIMDPYGGSVRNTSPQVLENSISKETADIVTDMMIDVVEKGTGTKAKISGISIAGKTGTAEVGKDKPAHSWFVAFAPAEDPKIAISVIVEGGGTGGSKAALIAREIIGMYLK